MRPLSFRRGIPEIVQCDIAGEITYANTICPSRTRIFITVYFFKVWIVGEKVKDLTFHVCDICDKPIVVYGRLVGFYFALALFYH